MNRLWAVLLFWLFTTRLGLWAQAVPTFVGVRTFLGAPYVTNLEDLHADFAVLGVPFDEGTWGWPGERYGPRSMRESSQEYNHDLTEGFYYIDGDRTVLKGKHWADVGDVPILPTVPAQTDDKITEMVHTIRSKRAFPIALGGDRRGVEWALSQVPESGNIYITLDVDVMDPALAPATGTLEPDGLNFTEIDGLLKGVTSKGHLVGMDIVEVNPMRDSTTRTEQTAIRLLIDTLGAAFH